MSSPTARGNASSEAILKEAMRQFSEGGSEAVNIRGIAKTLGVNSSLVTYHFATREKLVETCLHRASNVCVNLLSPLMMEHFPVPTSGGLISQKDWPMDKLTKTISLVACQFYDALSRNGIEARVHAWAYLEGASKGQYPQTTLVYFSQEHLTPYMPVVKIYYPSATISDVMACLITSVLISVISDGAISKNGAVDLPAINGKTMMHMLGFLPQVESGAIKVPE